MFSENNRIICYIVARSRSRSTAWLLLGCRVAHATGTWRLAMSDEACRFPDGSSSILALLWFEGLDPELL